MNAQPSFKQGETSQNVATLLERIESADPSSPDIDEDNMGQSWGHYQFTAGGLSPSSSLTTWQDVGSVATALKLVAAALKTCREARLMCANAGASTSVGFISDVYLEKTLECLESCWVGAGGVSVHNLCGLIYSLCLDNRFFSPRSMPSYHTYIKTYILRSRKVTYSWAHAQTQAAIYHRRHHHHYPRGSQRSHRSRFYHPPAAHRWCRTHAGAFGHNRRGAPVFGRQTHSLPGSCRRHLAQAPSSSGAPCLDQ